MIINWIKNIIYKLLKIKRMYIQNHNNAIENELDKSLNVINQILKGDRVIELSEHAEIIELKTILDNMKLLNERIRKTKAFSKY